MAPGKEMEMLEAGEIEKTVEKINTEKDAEANQRRGGRGGAAAGATGTTAQGPEQVLASRPAEDGAAPE